LLWDSGSQQILSVCQTRRSQLLQMVSFSVRHSFLLQMTLCLGVVIGYPKFLQSIKGNADLHPNSLYDHHMNSVDGDVSWLKVDKFTSRQVRGLCSFYKIEVTILVPKAGGS